MSTKDAEQFAVGDYVTSRWSSSGAVWRVTELTGEQTPYRGEIVVMVSEKSKRTDRRASGDLRRVDSR